MMESSQEKTICSQFDSRSRCSGVAGSPAKGGQGPPAIGPHSALTICSCLLVPTSGIPSPSTPGSLTAPDPGSPLGPTWGLPPEVVEGALEHPFTGAFLPQEPAGDHTVMLDVVRTEGLQSPWCAPEGCLGVGIGGKE